MGNSVAQTGNQAIQYCHFLNEIPEKNASRLHCKALAMKTLAIITAIAMVAIVAAVLAVSLGIGTTTGTLPFVLVGLAIATVPLSLAYGKLWEIGINYEKRAETERGVAEELKLIADWRSKEILEFIDKHPVLKEIKLPAELVCGDEPRLLRLIARFNYIDKHGCENLKVANEAIEKVYEDDDAAFSCRQQAGYIKEGVAVPMALEAAVMLRIISEPTLELKLNDIGRVHVKNIAARILGRMYDKQDDYFVFNDPKHPPLAMRPSLTLAELESNLDPDAVYLKLFPPDPIKV